MANKNMSEDEPGDSRTQSLAKKKPVVKRKNNKQHYKLYIFLIIFLGFL